MSACCEATIRVGDAGTIINVPIVRCVDGVETKVSPQAGDTGTLDLIRPDGTSDTPRTLVIVANEFQYILLIYLVFPGPGKVK